MIVSGSPEAEADLIRAWREASQGTSIRASELNLSGKVEGLEEPGLLVLRKGLKWVWRSNGS